MKKIMVSLLILIFSNLSFAGSTLFVYGKVRNFNQNEIQIVSEKHIYGIKRKYIPKTMNESLPKNKGVVKIAVPLRGISSVQNL